jgi:hypothetical protein
VNSHIKSAILNKIVENISFVSVFLKIANYKQGVVILKTHNFKG